jgi:hypothetical protein
MVVICERRPFRHQALLNVGIPMTMAAHRRPRPRVGKLLASINLLRRVAARDAFVTHIRDSSVIAARPE